MLAFTSDIDWAPEEVIADMLSLFEAHRVKCTLFCTHKSKVIDNCNRELFELAIHPNFNPVLEGKGTASFKAVFDELKNIFPEAKGIRSHSLAQSSHILSYACENGIEYDSNILIPYANYLKPFNYWYNLVRIPYNFIDDAHWLYGNSFDDPKIDIKDSSILNVLDFHPIHVFLNSERESTYLSAKQDYHNSEKLLKFRNKSDTKGTRDLLLKLLEDVKKNNLKTYKMIEISR